MVRLAIDDNQSLNTSDIEFNMPRPSYTIDTLAYLHQRFPSYEFVLIMGEDNLPTLPKWKNYEQGPELRELPVSIFTLHGNPISFILVQGYLERPLVEQDEKLTRRAYQ